MPRQNIHTEYSYRIALVIDLEYDDEGIVEAALYVGKGNGDRGPDLSYYGCHFQDTERKEQ